MKSAKAQRAFRQWKFKELLGSGSPKGLLGSLKRTLSTANFAYSKLFTRTNIVIILFTVFLFLRLFTSTPYIILSDDLKYMETAKNFPYHTLYNDQLYLLHPPLFPYAIHFFNLIFGIDHIAGLFISILSAAITFFVIYKFFMMLTNSFNITFFILLFYTLSEQFIRLSRLIFKDSMQVMLIFLSLYYFVRIVKFTRTEFGVNSADNEKKSVILASLFGSLLAITSDFVVLIFPAFILSYLLLNREQINIKKFVLPNLKYAVLPFLFALIVYGSWTGIKFYQYSNNGYYPNGYMGIPLSTNDLGLMQAVSPLFFDDYEPIIAPHKSEFTNQLLKNVGYMLNVEPFSLPRGLNTTTIGSLLSPKHVVYIILLYLPLAFAAFIGFLFTIKELLKTRQIHNNIGLYMLGLFLIFLIPTANQLPSSRYVMPSYIFLFYFIGYGFTTIFQKKWKLFSTVGVSRTPRFTFGKQIMLIITILLLLLIPFWYYNNNNFIFSNKTLISIKNTGDYINKNIPKDAGIMVQAGYTTQLLYLTDNRIVGLYHVPKKLVSVIDYYNISYVIFGKYYTFGPLTLSKDSAEFIINNSDKFQHIATIEDEYPDEFYQELIPNIKDEVYIYKVIKN